MVLNGGIGEALAPPTEEVPMTLDSAMSLKKRQLIIKTERIETRHCHPK
jgi:hypothetical protein